ncbi:MAG: cell cycle transcriptional regulator TrcR, partial [Gemmobacter sp.]
IQAIRERTHWNSQNIAPIDPVALGLCKQSELDLAVQQAARKRAAEGGVMSDDERRKLVSTEQSLGMGTDPKMPGALAGVAAFGKPEEEEENPADYSDADSFFNLPHGEDDDEDDDN